MALGFLVANFDSAKKTYYLLFAFIYKVGTFQTLDENVYQFQSLEAYVNTQS